MVNIAIDARFYGTENTGLGRYTTNVLKYLPKYLAGHTLQVLLRDKHYNAFPTGKNIQKVRAEIPHYSLAEQIQLPLLLRSIKADLLYTFHFNTPVASKIATIVTVHDLIKTHFTGQDTTTRAPWLYAIKRYGYNQVIKRTLRQAEEIIVPTNTVKNDILAAFPYVKPEHIHPIPEAPDEIFRTAATTSHLPSSIPDKYILFVGNVYPHKNLKVLLSAMKALKGIDLVIVAKRTAFLDRTLAPFDQSHIHVLSEVTDQELVGLYRHASVLVTPSLMEGYGLVGLEALMVGTPVIASNIPVYREVYGNRVSYVDPASSTELAISIAHLLKEKKPTPLHFDRTWDDVAHSIAEVIHARCTRL